MSTGTGDDGDTGDEVRPGDMLGGYRVEGELGRGAMGVVFRAQDQALARAVAIKVITGAHADDPGYRKRFTREAKAAARIVHPHAVAVHAAGEHAGRPYLVMQFVAGCDLRALLERRRRLDPLLAVTAVNQVSGALDAVHRAGMIHRDVKPANILLEQDSDPPHAYLSDFGLARGIETSQLLTESGVNPGTPAYMAPELRFGGSPAVCTDVYSLGATLFQLLAGRLLGPRNLDGGLAQNLDDVVPDPALAAALHHVVATATALDPADRYPSAGALGRAAVAALERFTSGGTSTGGFLPPPVRPIARSGAPTPVPATTSLEPVTRPAPVWTGEDHVPAGSSSARRRKVPWRGRMVVLAAPLAIAAAATAVALVRTDGREDRPDAAAPRVDMIVLGHVVDDGGAARLTWTGPDGFDFGVEIEAMDGSTTTHIAGRAASLTVPIDPGQAYCFRVRGTSGAEIVESNAQPLRRTTCSST